MLRQDNRGKVKGVEIASEGK